MKLMNNPLRTREDLKEAVREILKPLKSFYSEGCARLRLGHTCAAYNKSIAEMEAFSRPLWALAPLFTDREDQDFSEIYIEGVKNGTNPKHSEYWGEVGDYDQRLVEMAALGLGLILAPHVLWEPLSAEEKHNLTAWLEQVNIRKAWDCNWRLFAVMVNLGLKNVGASYNEKVVKEAFDKIEEFYLGDGWYADGKPAHSDYYVSFAIYFYSLIYAKVMEKEDPVHSGLIKERANVFAKDFIYWFSEDGSSIPYGRSMTYRFAQAAFWSAYAFAGANGIPFGVVKGIILRNLRWWFKQNIFQSDGILTIGYGYPNIIMSEGYNAPGSPYWALKTFLVLALDENHPFWKVKEEPLPELESLHVEKHPHMVICRDGKHVAAFAAGHCHVNVHTHSSAKYEKFVYSNMFAFSVPKSSWGVQRGGYDSTLALSERDNFYRTKMKSEEFSVSEDFIYSKWKPWNDVVVESYIVPSLPWHVRIHRIRTQRELDALEGGFAFDSEKAKSQKRTENGIFAEFEDGRVGIVNLIGERKADIIATEANTNLLFPRASIPSLHGSLSKGEHILGTAVLACLGDGYENSIPTVEFENDRFVVTIGKKRVII